MGAASVDDALRSVSNRVEGCMVESGEGAALSK
jgi:hypothetical protein